VVYPGYVERFTVEYSRAPDPSRAYRDFGGVYVTSNMLAEPDSCLPRGYYTVRPDRPVRGESGDGAFLASALGVPGLFSFDLRDGIAQPIGDAQRKLSVVEANERYAIFSIGGWITGSGGA
jgi:hypothetical protein